MRLLVPAPAILSDAVVSATLREPSETVEAVPSVSSSKAPPVTVRRVPGLRRPAGLLPEVLSKRRVPPARMLTPETAVRLPPAAPERATRPRLMFSAPVRLLTPVKVREPVPW